MAAEQPPHTHTPLALASQPGSFSHTSRKSSCPGALPQTAPSPKALFMHYCTWLRKPHTGTLSPDALPTPTLLCLEALHPHKAPQPRSPAYTQLSAHKTRPQANKSSLCPEARLQSGLPSSGGSPSRPTSPVQSPYCPESLPLHRGLQIRSSALSAKATPAAKPRPTLAQKSGSSPKPPGATAFGSPSHCSDVPPPQQKPHPQNDRRGRGPSTPTSPPPPLAGILSAWGSN